MTPKQREIMKHALGAGRGRTGWRNHFVTGPGSDDYADCEALVAAGLMAKRSGGPLSGGEPVYRVTDAGQDALLGRVDPLYGDGPLPERGSDVQERCKHRDEPRGCYRVRCQLGRKCVDA